MGPRLVFDTFDDIRGRCDLAPVRLAGSESGYDDGALVPGDSWSPLTADADDLTGRLEIAAALDPLNGRWPADLLGCAASPGNWATTTEDSTTRRRIGLHVDNFDRLPYATRHQGRRRLCLNLGPGPRYLLVGDRDVQQICRALYLAPERRYPHPDDVRRYVAAAHPLHCLRIRLEPGEGYIAPTECLPHDGSTVGIDQPSVAAFWLGRPPNAS